MRIRQIHNFTKILLNHFCSVCFNKYLFTTKPFAVSIEPANYCNLSCPQCPTGLKLIKKNTKLLSLDNYKIIVDKLLPELSYLNLYFQGEPFFNKELCKMVEYASGKGVYTVISTNAHFLSNEVVSDLKNSGLGKLIVCLDGYDQQSYAQYRVGGNFTKVLEGIKLAANAGLNIELQCLLLSTTEYHKNKIIEIAKSIGVNKVVFKKAQFYDKHLMPEQEGETRYKFLKDGSFVPKKALNNYCWRLSSSVVIDINGNVLPCCYDKSSKFSFGNIFESDIKDIMNSNDAVLFRQKLLSNRKSIDICCNCTE